MTIIAIIVIATAIGYGLALILFAANDRRQKFRSQGADQSEIDWLEWHRKLNEESYRALYGEQTPLGGKERK